MVGLEVA